MVKQTKKGSIGKKALSAILAASMIMTSSSFVMADPVVEEVEAVAVEEAAVVEEAEASSEESVAAIGDYTVNAIADVEYTGKAQTPEVTVTKTADGSTLDKSQYTVAYTNNVNVGTAKAIVMIVGETETIEKEFKITAKDLSGAKINIPDIKYVYNGAEQRPQIESVVIEGDPLTTDDDITVPSEAYEVVADETVDYVNAGDKKPLKIKAVENGNFTGEASVNYDIQKATMKASDVTITASERPYGTPLTDSAVKVVDNRTGKELDDTEFDVKVKDKDGNLGVPAADAVVGTHTFYIVTTGSAANYVAGTEIESTYNVVSQSLQAQVNDADLAAVALGNTLNSFVKDGDTYTVEYNGADHWPTIKKVANGVELDKQFKIVTDKAEWKNAGKYSVELEGINNYAGAKATIDFEIKAKKLADGDVKASYSLTHAGNKTAATVVVTKDGNELKEGTDYTYTEDAAKGTVTVTGIGNYAGTVTKIAGFTKMSVDNAAISATVAGTYNWTGKKIPVKVSDITIVENDATPYTLKPGTDYTIAGMKGDLADNSAYVEIGENAGENIITINGTGNYAGTRKIKVNVIGTDFNTIAEIAPMDDVKLTGSDLLNTIKGAVKVLYKSTGAVYDPNGYEVAVYPEGKDQAATTVTEVGTYRVVVTPKNSRYSGTLETTVKVVGKDLKTAAIADIKDQAYTGEPVQPKLVVTFGVTPLEEGKDYKVEFINNVKSGVATATIIGIGDYSGKKSITFNIVGQMDQKIAVLPAQANALKSRTLNDKATKIKYSVAPETAVTYASSDEDVVTIDEEGNIKYTGLGTATITITATETEEYKAATVELEVNVGLKQPTFSPSSKNNAFTVTTSTVKGAEKFQVQYVPTGKSFTSKAAKSKTFTVDNKLKKGKISAANKETYRVRVRAINGDTKSKWSPVKTIATL